MNWDKLKGKFIVLDGPDGAGKSTQIRLLAEALEKQGVAALVVRDPGGTAIGEKIRQILLDKAHGQMSVRCEMLLYMASRAQLYSEQIVPALQQGLCVLCDRWVSSTYAYQAVAGALGPEVVLQLAETVLERTWPDLTIILDLPSDEGLRRVGMGKRPGRVGKGPDRVGKGPDRVGKGPDRVGKGPGRKRHEELSQAVFDWGHTPDRMEEKGRKFHQQVREAFLELARGRANFRVVEGVGSIDEVHRRLWQVMCAYVDS